MSAKNQDFHQARHDLLTGMLVEARKKKGLSQADLAKRLGKQQTYVSKYERGVRRLDVIEFLHIADVLRASPERILREVRKAVGDPGNGHSE